MLRAFLSLGLIVTFAASASSQAPAPEIPAISDAMRAMVAKQEIAGVVTLVATRNKIIHLSAVGESDIAAATPMRDDAIFWIASMTKPVTACAVMMLQDEGKLSVDDPVAKYLPELASLQLADGAPANITLRHLLTHTSGLAEASKPAKTLKELIPQYAQRPVLFPPGTKWVYSQSGINALGRIIEIVSGASYEDFLKKQLFDPLGMKDTSLYPPRDQLPRIAKPSALVDGKLREAALPGPYDPSRDDRCPAPNGGLFSTAPDYARLCQMMLNEGELDGKRYLKAETVRQMVAVQTGELDAGFSPGHGWGLGWCVVRKPQEVTAMLSPGTFGHVGVFGTHAWIDPQKQMIYVMMVQRTNFPSFDASEVRRSFQSTAATALAK